GPAGAEEIRAARRAERLRASFGRLERAQQLAAPQDPDGRRANPDVRSPDAAREPLARRAVAERQRTGLFRKLELHAPAETASLKHYGVIVEPGGTLGSDTVLSSVTVPPGLGLSCSACPSAMPAA